MPNSDTAHGIHNKYTIIVTQPADETDVTHSSVADAKAFFFSAAALTVIDECATQEAYELTDGNKGLKMTLGFGTKGTGTAPADDWAEQFKSRKGALEGAEVGPFNISAIAYNQGSYDDDEATVTAAGHTFVVGDYVKYADVGGSTELNGYAGRPVIAVDGNTFVTSASSGKTPTAYTSGGTATKVCNAWAKSPYVETVSSDHLF